jgi:small subunit ribosomal protein S9
MPRKKNITKKTPKKKTVKKVKKVEKKPRYFKAIGRRKTSTAQVRLFRQGGKTFLVNEKPLEKYFPSFELQQIVLSPLDKMSCLDRFKILVKVRGGGINSQAEAVRHGIAKALILFDPDFRKQLKKAGFLTRDPRMRERKKFGLKRARRAPQWAKR